MFIPEATAERVNVDGVMVIIGLQIIAESRP